MVEPLQPLHISSARGGQILHPIRMSKKETIMNTDLNQIEIKNGSGVLTSILRGQIHHSFLLFATHSSTQRA